MAQSPKEYASDEDEETDGEMPPLTDEENEEDEESDPEIEGYFKRNPGEEFSTYCRRLNFTPEEEKNMRLFFAVQDNNLEELKRLLEEKANCNIRTPDQFGYHSHATPLHLVQSVEALKLLCGAGTGADINAKDDEDFTPLHDAILAKRLGVARVLIELGADINIPNFMQETARKLAENANLDSIVALMDSRTSQNENKMEKIPSENKESYTFVNSSLSSSSSTSLGSQDAPESKQNQSELQKIPVPETPHQVPALQIPQKTSKKRKFEEESEGILSGSPEQCGKEANILQKP